MAGTIKPTRRTRRRGAALLAVAVVLLSAPVAWALGERGGPVSPPAF